MSEVLKSGGNMDQALALGLIASTLSAATEHMQFNRLTDMIKTETLGKGFQEFLWGMIKNTFKQGIPEGMEEFAEWAGNLLADTYYRKGEGQISKMLQENLKAAGGDTNKAWAATMGQLAMEAKDELLGGVLAGSFFGELGTIGMKVKSLAQSGGGGMPVFIPGPAQVQVAAAARENGDYARAAALEYGMLLNSGIDTAVLSTNPGAVAMGISLLYDTEKTFTPERLAVPEAQAAAAQYDTVINATLGIDPGEVAKILPQVTWATTAQGDGGQQAGGTAALFGALRGLDERTLTAVTNHVLSTDSSLRSVQTLSRVLQLRDMETGTKSQASETALETLTQATGDALRVSAAGTGNLDLDAFTRMANQTSHNMDAIRQRWGDAGVNYISNLVASGRGDLAAAVAVMPTYAKSAIVAETNMRAFALNGTAVAAQESALAADMQNRKVVQNAGRIARLQAESALQAQMLDSGEFGDVSGLQKDIDTARTAHDASQVELDKAAKRRQALVNAHVSAQARFAQNPADDSALNELMAAIDQVQASAEGWFKAEAAVKASGQALAKAQERLDGARQQAMAKARDQVKQEIAELRLKQEGAGLNRQTVLDKLLSGLVATAQAEGKAEPLTVAKTQTYQSSPKNVSNQSNTAKNATGPLAPNNGRGIINEGSQAETTDGGTDGAIPNPGRGPEFRSWNDFSIYFQDVAKDATLTNAEKVRKIQEAYNRVTDKTDINVPIDAKYVKGFTAVGRVDYDWPKYLGLDESTIASITRSNTLPENGDRYGPMQGSNFSDVPPGVKYTYSERSLPYVQNEKAYHKVRFNNATYFDKIDAIRFGDLDALNGILESEEMRKMDTSEFENLREYYDAYLVRVSREIGDYVDATYGIKGKAAAWGDLAGGAGQLVTPFRGDTLKALGILKEE